MKIEKDRVVRFHYTVAEQGSEALESSKDREPLAILAGHGNIIPGLEKAMEGREAGDVGSAHQADRAHQHGVGGGGVAGTDVAPLPAVVGGRRPRTIAASTSGQGERGHDRK